MFYKEDFTKEEITCLELGNYNLLFKKLEQKKELMQKLDKLKNVLTAHNVKNIYLPAEYLELLEIPAIPCIHNLVVPLLGQNQGAIMFPDFQFVVFTSDHSHLKKIHCEESVKDAYEILLPVLWQIQPLVYLEKENFHCNVLLPGGRDCDFPIDGRSAGLGCLIAMLMSVTRLKLPYPIAMTGSLETKEEESSFSLKKISVHKVSNIQEKVDAILRERPDIERILIPKENEPEYLTLQDKSKVTMISTLEEAIVFCFGEDWKKQAAPVEKEIRYKDTETFFAQARNVQKKLKEAYLARKMYFHLEEYLKDKKDAESRNILCWTLHRIGNTYRFEPSKKKEYLQKSLELFQKLQEESMVSDIREELKLYTSYCNCMRQTFEYSKAEIANEKLMQFPYGDYNRMPNFSIQGQITMAKGEYEKSQKSFETAMEISYRTQDVKSVLDYKSDLLFLYTLWKQWDKAIIVYQEVESLRKEEDWKALYLHPSKEDKIKIKQREFLGWATVYKILPDKLLEDKEETTLNPGSGARGHFLSGLLNISHPKKALTYFQQAANDYKNMQKTKEGEDGEEYFFKNLWSIVPLVWTQYAMSLQKGKPTIDKKCIEKIHERLSNYDLKDLKEPLLQHIQTHEKIEESMEAIRDWCFGFRRLISST